MSFFDQKVSSSQNNETVGGYNPESNPILNEGRIVNNGGDRFVNTGGSRQNTQIAGRYHLEGKPILNKDGFVNPGCIISYVPAGKEREADEIVIRYAQYDITLSEAKEMLQDLSPHVQVAGPGTDWKGGFFPQIRFGQDDMKNLVPRRPFYVKRETVGACEGAVNKDSEQN